MIKDDNQQVYTTLPKELVKKIDADAAENVRSRSKQIAKIIIDHYKKKEESK